jgi:dTDP-4-dehydrorhamnose reductase
MKVLITGANGFLGQHLSAFLSKKSYNVTATNRGICKISNINNFAYLSLDLLNKEAVNKVVNEVLPDVIIHTAAMSKPDECNENKEACIAQNVLTVEYLLEAAKSIRSFFIYVSTDFVFGENGPHNEEDTPAPLNFYGESKLMAERLVQDSGLPFAIMRPVFIYGPVWPNMRPSFLHWVKQNLENGKRIKVVSDQQRTPTYVYDICEGIDTIIRKKITGTFHLAGKDIISPYEMAVSVAKVLGLDESLIENVTSETFPETVKRAKKSGLKIDKAVKMLDYHPVSFEEGIRLTFT